MTPWLQRVQSTRQHRFHLHGLRPQVQLYSCRPRAVQQQQQHYTRAQTPGRRPWARWSVQLQATACRTGWPRAIKLSRISGLGDADGGWGTLIKVRHVGPHRDVGHVPQVGPGTMPVLRAVGIPARPQSHPNMGWGNDTHDVAAIPYPSRNLHHPCQALLIVHANAR